MKCNEVISPMMLSHSTTPQYSWAAPLYAATIAINKHVTEHLENSVTRKNSGKLECFRIVLVSSHFSLKFIMKAHC